MTAVLRFRNLVAGVVLVLLGGATLVATSEFPWDRAAAADPALLPRVVAVLLLGVGTLIGILGAVQARSGAELPVEDGEGAPVDIEVPDEVLADREPEGTDVRAGLLTAALVTAYAIAAFQLGFVTSTALFLIAGALVLGYRRRWRSLLLLALFTAVLTAAYYAGFFILLGVREPNTLLP